MSRRVSTGGVSRADLLEISRLHRCVTIVAAATSALTRLPAPAGSSPTKAPESVLAHQTDHLLGRVDALVAEYRPIGVRTKPRGSG
jgi:hypothetical protein